MQIRHIAGIVLGSTTLALLTSGNPVTAEIPQIAQDAKKVFTQHCYKCHGENGVATSGLNILKWEQLTGPGGPIVPNKPDESEVYGAMNDFYMPPADDDRVKEIPTADEVAIIRDWILAGAPNFEEAVKTEFISPNQMIAFIESDLREKVGVRDRQYARYFTLTHLYNAGIRDDEIETYRLALSKLINSLSWKRNITVPVPVDPQRTIYRIDLRDYDWDVREYDSSAPAWDAIIAQNPYNVGYEYDAAGYCTEQTGHHLPFVRGDWFVAAASRPPLYHHILEIPETDSELERRLGVNVSANIDRERVVRAGFTRSGVSDNNRLIERHRSRYGAYWKSYDFAGNKGRKLLTQHPLGPGADERFFEHDGGEIIFNLPNGLQAYMLTSADGTRIDKGPIEIVKDPNDMARAGGAVVNGLSCMHCHDQGMIRKSDEIRPFVLANPVIFQDQPGLAESIKSLYPEKSVLDGWLDEDARMHIRAAEKAGSPVTEDPESGQLKLVDAQPVVKLSTQFFNELDLNLAAAEAGATPDGFKTVLGQSRSLAEQLGLLLIPGKTVKRDTYVAAFPEIILELKLGTHVPPVETPFEIDKPFAVWLREAQRGDGLAQFTVGKMYDSGDGVEQDDLQALHWYHKSAEQGNMDAQNNLGVMYQNGEGVTQDLAEAVRFYRLAAEQGSAISQNNLAVMYFRGEGVAQSDIEAVYWYRRAAEQGNLDAQNNLGDMHRDGRGVPQDDGEAIRWYRRAADAELAVAQVNVGWMYAQGRSVPRNDAEAVKWYRLAADQGSADGYKNLADMYRDGLGVTQDDAEAVRLYRQAAESEIAAAQTNLGFMYQNGRGVTQNDTEAVRYYRLAANQGEVAAQYNLGWMYEHGRGVTSDLSEAIGWYRKSADQGDEDAKNALIRLEQ